MASNYKKCTAPNQLDKYYISTSKGGYSEYPVRNSRTGYTIPNCTSYAEGQFNKTYNFLTGHIDGITYSFNGQAQNFYNDARRLGLDRGQTPKLGAIMVWSATDKRGHVAIVDAIYSDGSLQICESAYGGPDYKTYKANNSNSRWGWSSAYTFLGFVYNPAVHELTVPDNVARDRSREQVQVLTTNLRVRYGVGTDKEIVGFAKKGFYNVFEVVNDENYTWYRINDEINGFMYIAGVENAVVYCPIEIKVGLIGTLSPALPLASKYYWAFECGWRIVDIHDNTQIRVSAIEHTATIDIDAKYFIVG